RPRDGGGLDRARSRLVCAGAERRGPDARGRGRGRAMGVPRGRHPRRRALRSTPFPAQGRGMSYSLRGRVETRLAALLPLLLVACVLGGVLRHWWPVELVALMAAVGLVFDLEVWHRLFPSQPAWSTIPLGAVELGALLAIVYGFGLHAPLLPALVLFGA